MPANTHVAVPEKSDLVADSIMWNQGTSEILVAARSPLIGAATT